MLSRLADLLRATLIVEVSDDGPGLPDGWSLDRHAGVGLSNTRDRLAAMYGDAAELTVEGRPRDGVRARVRLPREPGTAEPRT